MTCCSFLAAFKRFIFRCFIYFIVLLWPYNKIQTIDHSTTEFKQKLQMNFGYFKINTKDFDHIIEDPSLVLLLYSFVEIIFGIMGIFGSFFGGIMSCICFILTNFVYFNPLFPGNNITLYETREELFLNIGTLCALLMATFYPGDDYKQPNTKDDNYDDVNDSSNNSYVNYVPKTQEDLNKKLNSEMPVNKKAQRSRKK